MASGPAHYRTAEALLEATVALGVSLPARARMNEVQSANDAIRNGYLAAQAHATLALAAATAEGIAQQMGGDPSITARAWCEAIS